MLSQTATTVLIVVLTILCTFSVLGLAVSVSILLRLNTTNPTIPKQVPLNKSVSEPAPSFKETLTEEEKEYLEKQKERYKAENEAFEELMNYNANKAYGIEPVDEPFKE